MQVGELYRDIETGLLFRCIEELEGDNGGYLLEMIFHPYSKTFSTYEEADDIFKKDSFGSRILYLRHKRGYSQRDLAAKMGVSNAAISRWENEVQEPTVSHIVKLCEALETGSDFLLGLTSRHIRRYER